MMDNLLFRKNNRSSKTLILNKLIITINKYVNKSSLICDLHVWFTDKIKLSMCMGLILLLK